MTNREEKMIEAITIKLPPSQLAKARAVAEANGMGVSEYIRSLIDSDIEAHRQKFVALASIFDDDSASGKE